MIVEALAIGGLGLAAAVGLGVAAKIFAVEVDPVVQAVEEALPGANCGGCGMAGCSSAAEAMAAHRIPPSACVGGGPEVQAEVATILGMEIKESEPILADVNCRYATECADVKYEYQGLQDCRAAVLLFGGPKQCPVGCLGLGTCVTNCPFGAIKIGPNGLPIVDVTLCTGCGTCERVCPMGSAGLTSMTNRIIGEYTVEECTAPCQRSCPAGIDVASYIDLASKGQYEHALAVIRERNPLPLICGRICPRPCEVACRRNLADEPVAIDAIKRFLADHEMQSGKRYDQYKAPSTERKVAVVGGGAEGLTAGYFLARLGHSPAIFEAEDKLGGLLRTALPKNRLPREVLDWEIQGILDLGVEAHTGQALGRDFSLSSLFEQGYEAIIMAPGGWDTMTTGGRKPQEAAGLPGVHLLLALNMAWATGRQVDLGDNVVLIGGGKEAVGTALKIKQGGASRVSVLWKESQAALGVTQEDLDLLFDQSIAYSFGAKATGLTGKGDQIENLEFESDGAGNIIAGVSSVVVASGRMPKFIFTRIIDPYDDDQTVRWRSVRPYGPMGQGPTDLFDELEPVSDHRAAVEAIGSGRRAAATVHRIIEGMDDPRPERMLGSGRCSVDVMDLEDLLDTPPRQMMPLASAEAQLDPAVEIELGFDEQALKTEASRCLNCGLLCYKRNGKMPAQA